MTVTGKRWGKTALGRMYGIYDEEEEWEEVKDEGFFAGHVEGFRLWRLFMHRDPPTEEAIANIRRGGVRGTIQEILQDLHNPPQERLGSVGISNHFWSRGVEEYTASCMQSGFWGEHLHEVPDPDCGCGWWGMWNIYDLPDVAGAIIIGKIIGYGKVVEYVPEKGGLGFRAEKAKIKEIYNGGPVNSGQLRRVAHIYGVPLVPVPEKGVTWPLP